MADWLINLGYWGLFVGSFVASTLVPFSSDVLLIGILALGGNPWTSLVVATAGNWLGGMSSYAIGWLGKWSRIERWLHISEEKLLAQKRRIDRWGVLLAFFAWLPVVGDIFAVGLGFYRIRPVSSAIFMFVGRFVRFLAWTLLYLRWGETITGLF
ncbi:MAG: DedA family protein [Rikenellaceae bacterium]|jgi:membrane protein YqaA with SNARE-associated domain|nr:DedA family protein [Rikenellaceae bacterium]